MCAQCPGHALPGGPINERRRAPMVDLHNARTECARTSCWARSDTCCRCWRRTAPRLCPPPHPPPPPSPSPSPPAHSQTPASALPPPPRRRRAEEALHLVRPRAPCYSDSTTAATAPTSRPPAAAAAAAAAAAPVERRLCFGPPGPLFVPVAPPPPRACHSRHPLDAVAAPIAARGVSRQVAEGRRTPKTTTPLAGVPKMNEAAAGTERSRRL